MTKNIGTKDRIVRFVFGILFALSVLFTDSVVIKIALGAAGIFCWYEAAVGWCLVNAMTGKNTCATTVVKNRIDDEHDS